MATTLSCWGEQAGLVVPWFHSLLHLTPGGQGLSLHFCVVPCPQVSFFPSSSPTGCMISCHWPQMSQNRQRWAARLPAWPSHPYIQLPAGYFHLEVPWVPHTEPNLTQPLTMFQVSAKGPLATSPPRSDTEVETSKILFISLFPLLPLLLSTLSISCLISSLLCLHSPSTPPAGGH